MQKNDEEAMFMALIISVNRVYDLLLMLLAHQAGDDAANNIRSLHAEGKLWAPPPFKFEEDNDGSPEVQ